MLQLFVYYTLLISISVVQNALVSANEDAVEMRIVDEPTVYSWQQNSYNHNENRLKMKIDPAPFSGPAHLERLSHKCFKNTIEKYEYQFCPFSNITQKDLEATWNSYQGVLGVWQEWTITNNTFMSMMMYEGDNCGAKPRQTEVKIICGKENEIEKVSEPRHCEYELVFSTPLVCHNHSMLVYPSLSEKHQLAWNHLLGELEAEDITMKGYNKELNKIFQSAGFLLPSSKTSNKQTATSETKDINADTKVDDSAKPFSDLHTCNAEYIKLHDDLEAMRAQFHADD